MNEQTKWMNEIFFLTSSCKTILPPRPIISSFSQRHFCFWVGGNSSFLLVSQAHPLICVMWWKLSHHQSLDGTHLCWNQLFIHSFFHGHEFVFLFSLLSWVIKKKEGGHLIFWHPPKQNGGFVPNRLWHMNCGRIIQILSFHPSSSYQFYIFFSSLQFIRAFMQRVQSPLAALNK